MKSLYLILIFLFSLYYESHASINLVVKPWKDASTLAQKYPKFLMERKIERIGHLNVNELVQKMSDKSEITFVSLFDLNKKLYLGGSWINPINDLERVGAECYTAEATRKYFQDPIKQLGSKRFVVINEHSPLYQDLDPYYLQFTLLHESLCSFYGFSADSQYQMTSSMVFILGLLREPDQLNKYLKNNKWNFLDPFMNIKLITSHREPKSLNQKNRLPAGGGVTVGPGGGDPWAAYLKFILMNLLHGKELSCEEQRSQQVLNNLSCDGFLKKMQLYWDQLRQLNIETEAPALSIKLLGEEIPSHRYRIRNNSDSSISLVFNRTCLKEIESEFKDKPALEKSKKHIKIITEAFSELITIWNKEL